LVGFVPVGDKENDDDDNDADTEFRSQARFPNARVEVYITDEIRFMSCRWWSFAASVSQPQHTPEKGHLNTFQIFCLLILIYVITVIAAYNNYFFCNTVITFVVYVQ
jgi:hypothetical protein